MAKKSKLPALAILIVILALVVGLPLVFLSWWWQVTIPIDPQDTEKQIIVVPKGAGVSTIAQTLKEKGLIRQELAFKIMVTKEGMAKNLQAGDFYLNKSMNLFEIAQTLTHGTVDVWVTVPEGLRREEMVAILTKSFSNQGVDFDGPGFLAASKNLEGYLFPDTYLVPKIATADQIVKIFRDTFDTKMPDQEKLEANKLGLSFSQVVILASLVEREAKYNQDRAIVAGILVKRLKKDWPLQIDATIQYALGTKNCQGKTECNWWPQVTDTKLDSVYNTYLKQGLPPTPICNPSLTSIKAVLKPQDTKYWYYVSDSGGHLHYAETLEEQKTNITEYVK
ncbi:hypothetical protein A2160_00785 [Candidatus Beckwithbacteria bacterium RBG_13_42_9]|uniref:Endolytic murein transglycosylase n=1 Tax=Candidatus Beckwithbacteria bacterium RBG_13_42_9 TaxID=1797457 RepID=A0A1F5E3C4_9BACT|nr:MAG: hypothetical protein A2160_00785 [Candidatus Beckwithbacteria bacterium RBG_13_42_9]